jgi:14-3-3 protein epsilon
MLSVAAKNETTKRRQQWVVVQSNVNALKLNNASAEYIRLTEDYREKIEDELKEICLETITMVENVLLPRLLGVSEHAVVKQEQKADESDEQITQDSPKTVTTMITEGAIGHSPRHKSDQKIFYLKMSGDYHRYMAEIQRGEARIPHSLRSREAYEKALEIARDPKAGVATTHPIRLGLALNYSVFHHEIREDTEAAINIAQQALDEGLEDLDALSEMPRAYKDAALILKLLKDNIAMWQAFAAQKSNNGGSSGDDGGVEAVQKQLSQTHIEEKE